jgi:hypothetical protein
MIVSTTIDGIDVELVIIEPDWSYPVNIEMGIAIDSSIGETGKESRHPESLHPRFKLIYSPDWLSTHSEDLITLRATVGTKRIAMPIHADTRTAISDTFLFEGAHYVSWNDAGTLYAVDADTYPNVAPLVFGYLENNKFQAKTDEVGATSITFVEDCPYSHRVKIKAVDTDETFTLDPEWTQITEDLNSPIEYKELGLGRERSVESRESVFHYEMDAGFHMLDVAEIGYMLSFWYQHKGRLHPFTVPAWFQPAAATEETPDAYFARFRGENLKLQFTTSTVASTTTGFVQVPWELNNSGVEHATDWLFEDSSQWTGFDANVTVVAPPGGITNMPERVVRIVPADFTTDRAILTPAISAAEDDTVVISAMVAKADSIVLGKAPRLGIKVYNSSDALIVDTFMTAPASMSEAAGKLTFTYTFPATSSYYKAFFASPYINGTVPGDAYSYFGDPSVMHYKSGAEVLLETPVQAPRCYAFDFSFDVPSKENIRLLDWERSIDVSGNTYSPYRMTVEDLTMGTRMFSEQATISYSHETDNPLIEYVLGGLERLVTLTLREGNPNRPDSFTTVFVGKLKSLTGKGRSLRAIFTAFGGIFENRLPGFVIQSKCNYILGDTNCGINLASLVATASCDSGDLSDGNMKILCASMSGTLTTINDPDSNPGDRFAGGYLTVGDDDSYQIRYIRKTTIGTGSDRTFTLNRPLDPDKLDASDGVVSVYPGCGGASWECSGFWSNYVNFGGHPFVPEKLDSVQGERPSIGK